MKIMVVVWVFISGLLLESFAFAATQSQIDQSWDKGLAWIMTHQHSDGGWSSPAGLGPQTTSEVIKTLARFYMKKGYTYLGGLSWLSNTESVSIDALTYQIDALRAAGEDSTTLVAKLLSWQNTGKAWGAYPQYGSSLPDTSLAIMTLLDAQGAAYSNNDIVEGVCQFLPAQLPTPDFLWPYSISTGAIVPPGQRSGAIVPTVSAIQALRKITPGRFTTVTCGNTGYTLATVINNAISGLLLKRKSDNGFGDGTDSTILETALVYRVLAVLRPTDSTTSSALDYLIAQQAADGSWGNNAFFTAMVVASLPNPSTLVDTDKDGVPDRVEVVLGKNPNLADSRFLATGSSSIITTPLMQKASLPDNSASAKTANLAGAGVKVNDDTSKATSFPNEAIDLEVFIAGSPAQLDVFEVVAASLFREDTPVEIFNDDGGIPGSTQGGNFRAYLGTISTTENSLLNGKRALIHFRGKGGSYNGVGPVALSDGIERMVIDNNCTDSSGEHYWSCPLDKTVLAIPDAGISEVHPAWHINQNVPQGAITPSFENIQQLDTKPIFKEHFGMAATRALLNTGFAKISRAKTVTLLAGLEGTGWSGIDPSLPQKPIIICSMIDGGQPAANALFLNIPCDPQASPARECDSIDVQNEIIKQTKLMVIENNSSQDLINCLNTANSGGLLTLSNPAKHIRVPENSFAVGILPTLYQPDKTDQWGYLAIEDNSTIIPDRNSLSTTFWMQWRKSNPAITDAQLALLTELRIRFQHPEMLRGFNGVTAVKDRRNRVAESCGGDER